MTCFRSASVSKRATESTMLLMVLAMLCRFVVLFSASSILPVSVLAASSAATASTSYLKTQDSRTAVEHGGNKDNKNYARETNSRFESSDTTKKTSFHNIVVLDQTRVCLSTRGGQQELQPQTSDEDVESTVTDSNSDENVSEVKEYSETDGNYDDDDLFFDDDSCEYNDDEAVDSETNKRHRFRKKRKLRFLNRIVKVTSLLLRKDVEATLDAYQGTLFRKKERQEKQKSYSTGLQYDDNEEDDERITQQSDLTRPGRYVHIVTTAALPWMTGTAVNPLLRAAYLHERLEYINNSNNYNATDSNTTESATGNGKSSYVTLVIPWLELPEDQRKVYNGRVFDSKDEQELYVRNWLENSANMPGAAANLNIVFYNARYHVGLGSVFAMGDILRELPTDELDVCVLEEPEHLNWFRAPSMESWTKRYNYVVGIVHTNYDQYASQHYSGLMTAPAIRLMSAAMVRAYCHKVIKLSAVVQDFAPEKEVVSNVHGVREEFIVDSVVSVETEEEVAIARAENISDDVTTNVTDSLARNESSCSTEEPSPPQAEVYFIGKLLWTKGLDILLEYQELYKGVVGEYFEIDIYGSGPDQREISRAYLGRQSFKKSNNQRNQSQRFAKNTKGMKTVFEKTSKHAFVRAFKWVNRRRRRKRSKWNKRNIDNTTKTQNYDNDTGHTYSGIDDENKRTIAIERINNDVMDVMESLPVKARESIDGMSSQLKESLNKLSEDVTKAQQSVVGLPAKTRKVVNQLIDDITSRANTFPLPRSLYEFRRQSIPATFPGRVDHAILKGNATDASQYKVFVNPSVSEVLCTTTAEALAMGKFVIIPVHPSNQFFLNFPNCLGYRTPYEFVANLRWALTHDPVPHTEEVRQRFTWEAATDRFLEASSITHKEARDRELLGRSKIDERIAWLHREMGKGAKGDILRKALGAGPVAGQVQYEMRQSGNATAADNEEEDGLEEGGLSRKFRNSVFVKALLEATTFTSID